MPFFGCEPACIMHDLDRAVQKPVLIFVACCSLARACARSHVHAHTYSLFHTLSSAILGLSLSCFLAPITDEL